MKKSFFKTFFLGAVMMSLCFGVSGFSFAEEPQYGGTLRMFLRPTIPPLTWDANDWGWKLNEDASLFSETLLAGDLQKGPRGTNEYDFKGDSYIPNDVMRGELAESWKLEQNPLRLVFKLRQGIYWQARKGVMESREFVADDVVYSFNRVKSSPKYIPTYWDFVDRWEATDKYTVTVYLNHYNTNWAYRFGWGYYSAINPKEVVEAGPRNWRNTTGTGPFFLKKYQKGSFQEYVKNPNYWDSTVIDSKSYKLPFVDKIKYILNKDEQSRLSALRTAKVDSMGGIRWNFAAELKKQVPDLIWTKGLMASPPLLAMRMDTKPFDDIRVRRAMALAINQQEILDNFWGGDGILFAYPYPPNWKGYFKPLEEQPADVQELYTYNPEKAKKLLAEAGYPDGFTVKAQANGSYQPHLDQVQMVIGYLSRVGIKLELETLAYGQYLGAMISKTHAPVYFHGSGHGNPLMGLRKNFVSNQTWNPYMMADPAFDKEVEIAMKTRDEDLLKKKLRKLTTYALQQVPYVQLPDEYYYTARWPWVKNAHGERCVGSLKYGPVHARLWIDHKLKKKMGYK